MILDNANVLTLDASVPRTAALAIAGGRILGGVDSREDAIASHAHERVDLQGATVLPGFVDSHVHFRAWAIARHRLQLAGAPDLEGALDRVRMWCDSRGEEGRTGAGRGGAEPIHERAGLERDADRWVLGGGWDDHLLAGGSDVGTLLEDAAGGLPAALVSHDGHAIWTTTATLERLGTDLGSLELPGGVVERDAAGRFRGVLREQSAWAVRRLLPDDDLDTRVLAGAMREAARRGVTTLHDMDGATALRTWRALEDERGLAMRVWVHLLAADLDAARQLGVGAGFGSERLALGGIKVFADGTLGSGTALLHEPEHAGAGREPRAGVEITGPGELRRLARVAGAAGFPLVVHAIGDAAVTNVVDALEATQEHWSHLRMRPRIEHAQLVRPADLDRCARLGVGLGIQPTHAVADRDLVDAAWGDRSDRAYAWRAMVDAGCGLLFGSDAPIEDLSPLAALHAATTRDGGAHGLAPARGAWHAEQAVDIETALLASSAWPADATGIGDSVGRLVPGRAADLVVLDGDPYRTPVAELQVVATMVGGRWTWGAANLG